MHEIQFQKTYTCTVNKLTILEVENKTAKLEWNDEILVGPVIILIWEEKLFFHLKNLLLNLILRLLSVQTTVKKLTSQTFSLPNQFSFSLVS